MGKKVWLVAALVLLLGLIWVPAASAAPPSGGGFWHTVHYGESLSTIGRRYGVNPYTVCTSNGLYNCNFIYSGQRLWIPGQSHPGHPGGGYGGCRAYHTVTYGQSLSGIAAWYGTSAWKIADSNGIYNMNLIYAGQRLCIPGR